MKYPALLLVLLFALPALSACPGEDPGDRATSAAADPAAAPSGVHGALSGMSAVLSSPQIGAPRAAASLRKGEVKETMSTAGYTYVQVEEGGERIWAAGPATPVEVGQRVEMPLGQAMANFHSSTLDRDFDEVFFVDWIRPEGSAPALVAGPAGTTVDPHGSGASVGSPHGTAAVVAVEDVQPLEGGVTVEAAFGGGAGDSVGVRGRLVKINRGILGFDWLHVQDGTGSASEGTHDLVVTAPAGVRANVGDLVVVRGTVATDKDFGAGYRYALLVEEASVTVE